MFTFFLVLVFGLVVSAIVFVTFSKPNHQVKQKQLAIYIANVRYLKKCAEECSDGLQTLEYSKRREALIEELLSYIEKNKLTDCDAVKSADIIKLDDFRSRQSA